MEVTYKDLRRGYLEVEKITRHFASEMQKKNHRPEFIAAAMMNIASELIRESRDNHAPEN